MGGVAAAWPVDDLIYQMNILFWVLLCLDLYRVGYFLNHRDRLNRRVLKPHHRHGRNRRGPQRQQPERPHQRGGREKRAQGPCAGH